MNRRSGRSASFYVHRVLLVLALAAFVACDGNEPGLAKLPADGVILAFGDSITYGTGARAEQSYPAELARLTGRKVINAGVPGEVTQQGLRRLPRVLDKAQPNLLVLCHGGNDILRKHDLNASEENIREMIRVSRERNVPVVLIGVPSVGLFLSPADLYESIADEMQVPFEDEILADLLSDNRYKSDHIHPNAKGYARMAEAVESLLREHGAL